jgi:cytoplasmic iron level regulating protein YaaA (DUF328/UPF0246 family)
LKATITKALNKELENDELFVNLVYEYFSAVDKSLKSSYITPDFKDYKDGKLKLLVFFAKKSERYDGALHY